MADQRITYLEEMVGFNHPTKADTLNRLVMVDHNNDGTHRKPAFSVHKNNAAQTLVSGTITKVVWYTKLFDTNNNFDIVTNNRFTPTVAGKYLFTASITWQAAAAGGAYQWLMLYKNGVEIARTTFVSQMIVLHTPPPLIMVADANGSTDYFELGAYQNTASNQNIDGGITNTYFTGCRID